MTDFMAQKYAYEIVSGSVTIWRCFSRTDRAEIPGEIEGYPVKKIAPYAFSDHMNPTHLSGKCYTSQEDIPALSGNQLREVVFPDTVEQVGRYCFYNCENLKRISFTDTLKDWGSGAFTGCHQVDELEVFVYGDGQTTLRDIMTEMTDMMTVDYHRLKDGQMEYAKLVFPEYYEEGVENTPARLINLTIHGSGMRYRNCFHQRVLSFSQYDACFQFAGFQETFHIVAALTEYRLRYPLELIDGAKEKYERFLYENAAAFGKYVVEKQDVHSLTWFVDKLNSQVDDGGYLSKEEVAEVLSQMTEAASLTGYHEGLSYLMDYQHRHGRKKKKMSFEL